MNLMKQFSKPKRIQLGFLVSLLIFSFGVSFFWTELTPFARAGVPKILSFQGRLTDSSGNLLGSGGTNYYFKFSIYSASSGGTKLWPSTDPSSVTIKVTQGVFNVLIGDTSASFPALDIDFDGSDYFLRVDVSDDNSDFETLAPRQRIVASGFAINADTVHGGRFINASGVGQFGSLSTVSYSRFGTAVTSHALSVSSDALISGILETDSQVFFDSSASVAGSFELTSALSKLAINAGGFIDTTLEVGGTASVSGTLTLAGIISSSNTGSNSFSGGLEVSKGVHASTGLSTGADLSVAKDIIFFGEIKPDGVLCTDGQILKKTGANDWDCATDSTGGGGAAVGLNESGGSFSNVTSISFSSSAFNVTFPNEALVKLDYDNGPASRTAAQTISGLWTFTGGASSSSGFEITTGNFGLNAGDNTDTSLEVGGTASISSTLTLGGIITSNNTGSNSFSGGLEVSKGVHATTGLSTAGSLTATGVFLLGDNGDLGSIDTSDWDISAAGALTGITGITNDGVYTQTGTSANTFTGPSSFSGGVSISTNFELTGNTRFGLNAGDNTDSSLEIGGTASISGKVKFGNNASVSGNVWITGYASSSTTFGSNLVDCDTAATSKLLWDAATGKFSCG
ncbi:MAG: hypothetical protein Q7S32_02285, partial [bacterium]|nr:hypothetical protein [bacterium]